MRMDGTWWQCPPDQFTLRAHAEVRRMRRECWVPSLPMQKMSPYCPAANGYVDGERWPVEKEPWPEELLEYEQRTGLPPPQVLADLGMSVVTVR